MNTPNEVQDRGNEGHIQTVIQSILEALPDRRFSCRVRKTSGISAIGKPVDLEIYFRDEPKRIAVAVEVANVNTTQMVGETCRLYFDGCPLKLLVLGRRNLTRDAQRQAERLLARLYGQEDISNTPARVVQYEDEAEMAKALKELLLA